MVKGGAIYVDDTGNPGVDSGSKYLPSSRKSWTAVIVPTIVATDVKSAMEIFLAGVRKDFGANELHFAEIWSGKGPWSDVSASDRAQMIELMARLMNSFSLPVVHQTVSEQTLDDHPDFRRSLEGKRVGDWKLDDVSQFGLLVLCSNVARHVRKLKEVGPDEFTIPLPLYIDEGMLPDGISRVLPNWDDVIEGPDARFRRSSDVPGIQLADFAAFTINRAQWLGVKRSPSAKFRSAEVVILQAAAGLNILNLPMIEMRSDEFTREVYERTLTEDRQAKGLPPLSPRR